MGRAYRSYVKIHRGAVYYQRPIPKALQHLFQGARLIVERIGKFVGGKDDKVARAEALLRADRDDKLFETYSANADAIKAAGGVKAVGAHVAALEARVVRHRPLDVLTRPVPKGTTITLARDPSVSWDADEIQLARIRTLHRQQQEERDLAQARGLSVKLKAAPTPAYSWEGLFTLWVKWEQPKVTRRHAATLKMLKQFFPDRDYRDVTREDARRFRDNLTKTTPYTSAVNALTQVKGLYRGATREGIMKREDVPFGGLAIANEGGVKAKERVPFSAQQARDILAYVKTHKTGGKRHEAFLWAVRLMVGTGCRPSEITQLQRGDVEMIDGVLVLRIREACAITGDRHMEKSIKTGNARVVPLAPELGAFYGWATDGEPGEFVFECFPFNDSNKRTGVVRDNLRSVLTKLKIEPKPAELLDGYSFRHRFIGAGRDRMLDDAHMRYVTGHAANLHEAYGRGVGLKHLAATVAAVRPLED